MVQKRILALVVCFLAILSCTRKGGSSSTPQADQQKSAPEQRELRIFTWSEYLRPEVIEEFEKENRVKVKLDYLSSNEELLSKVQLSLESNGAGYDLIQPSDYMIVIMRKLDILQKLDHSKLPVLKDFDPSFLRPSYDPDLSVSIPFAWGTTGIAVNTKLVPSFDPKKSLSWKDLLENPAFKGKTTLLEDSKEAVHLALRIRGKNLQTASEAEVKEAFAYLKKIKPNLRAITTEVRPLIEAGDCALCHAYSGDVLSIAKEKPEIKYVIPIEGATLWTDNFSIPKNAKNADLAYAFINKLLSASGAKRFTEATHYATPNLGTQKLLSRDLANNLFIFPDAKLKKRLFFMTDRPDLMPLMEKSWTELKSE